MDTVSFEEKIEIRHLTISKKVAINRYNLDFLQVCRQNWAATSLQFATTQEKPVICQPIRHVHLAKGSTSH